MDVLFAKIRSVDVTPHILWGYMLLVMILINKINS